MAIPKGQIRFLVDRMSCGAPVSEVRANIEERARKAGVPAKLAKACGNYAVKVHKENVKLYCAVTRGRL